MRVFRGLLDMMMLMFFLLNFFINITFKFLPCSARSSDNTDTLTMLFQMWFTLNDVADGINKRQEDHFHTLYDPNYEGCVNHNKNTSPAFCSGEMCGKCRLKSRNRTQWSIHIKTEMKVETRFGGEPGRGPSFNTASGSTCCGLFDENFVDFLTGKEFLCGKYMWPKQP